MNVKRSKEKIIFITTGAENFAAFASFALLGAIKMFQKKFTFYLYVLLTVCDGWEKFKDDKATDKPAREKLEKLNLKVDVDCRRGGESEWNEEKWWLAGGESMSFSEQARNESQERASNYCRPEWVGGGVRTANESLKQL